MLEIDAAVLRLHRRSPNVAQQRINPRERLLEALEVAPWDDLATDPALLRDLAGEIGAGDQRLLRLALEVVGWLIRSETI